jgi:hypothetical protein
MQTVVYVLGLVFWIPAIYLVFVAFWKAARMFVVLALVSSGVFLSWGYVPDWAPFVTVAFMVGALLWPLWLAWGEWQTRHGDSLDTRIAGAIEPNDPRSQKRRILGEL